VVTAANRAGLHVDSVVYEALMSADSTRARRAGRVLADIGAGSTDMIVFIPTAWWRIQEAFASRW
jgi:cell division ATPase FtsA